MVKYSGPFLKWTREELKQIDKEIYDDAQGLTPERWYRDYVCQEKKEKEDLPALRFATRCYNSRTQGLQ